MDRKDWLAVIAIVFIVVSGIGVLQYISLSKVKAQATAGVQRTEIEEEEATKRTQERHDTLHRLPFLKKVLDEK